MKFSLLALLVIPAWVALTFSMLQSSQLWCNDLYLALGFGLWSFLFARPFLTVGRERLFWSTLAATMFCSHGNRLQFPGRPIGSCLL